MNSNDHKTKIADNIMFLLVLILFAWVAYLMYDYKCKSLQNPPIEYKIIQVPHVDLYDTIYIGNSKLKTQN
jgi:hypothetical protein